jgi:hypothetical protein
MNKFGYRSKKLRQSVPIAGGRPCPKCQKPMQRSEHGPEFIPKGPYFFAFWDRCSKCRHTQHYEAAKRTQLWDEKTTWDDVEGLRNETG